MTLFEFKNHFFKNLKLINSQNEIEEFFFWLIEHNCNINRMGFMMNSSFKLSIIQTNNLFKSISLLKKNTPIQYVIGETEFMNLKFKLNNNLFNGNRNKNKNDFTNFPLYGDCWTRRNETCS